MAGFNSQNTNPINSRLIAAVNHVPNFTGGLRLPGNSMYTTGSSGIATTHYKIEAEAPFSAVRVWHCEKNTSGTPGTYTALVAPTETMDFSTVNNAYVPISGGTAYNSIATTGPGWRNVTWDNGAASKVATLTSGSNSATYMCSDWIPCKSIARTDVAGGRPAALLRLCQNDASGVYSILNGNLTTYIGARAQNWYREFFHQKTLNDGVGTLSNIPASVSATGGFGHYAWLEFCYDVPCRSVICVGDSTHETAYSTYQYDPWPLRGLLPLSTQSAPVAYVNLAGSGHSPTQFLALLDGILNAGMTPTDIIFQGWSQNGFTTSAYGADSLIAQVVSYLRKLRAAGVRVWMDTSYGVNGYTGTSEAARLKCVNWIKSIAASGLVTLIDTDSVITDYSAGDGKLLVAYDSGDHVHANPTGQALLSNLLESVWRGNANS